MIVPVYNDCDHLLTATKRLTISPSTGKILVLTGTTPGTGGVGNLLMRDCCEAIGRENFYYCAVVPEREQQEAANNGWVDQCLVRRYETAYRPVPGSVGNLISHAAFRLMCTRLSRSAARTISQQVPRNDLRVIWAVLDSPATILMARQLAKKLDLPIVAFVMDASEQVSQMYYHDPLTTHYLRRESDAILRSALACGAAGETMKECYESQYGIPCEILRQGAVETDQEAIRPTAKDPSRLLIGFAGTITAPDALAAFRRALDTVGWTVNGRSVVLRLVGSRCEMRASGPQQIEYFGWRSRNETAALLAECDLLYLPQPFTEAHRPFAELSFPNKLMAYLPSQKPIFLHGPPHASLVSFLKSYQVGIACQSLDAVEIIQSLAAMAKNPDLASKAATESRRAIKEELNAETLARNVRRLLGVEVDRCPQIAEPSLAAGC